jgi:hypothetical protein
MSVMTPSMRTACGRSGSVAEGVSQNGMCVYVCVCVCVCVHVSLCVLMMWKSVYYFCCGAAWMDGMYFEWQMIIKHRDDELHHRDIAIEHNALKVWTGTGRGEGRIALLFLYFSFLIGWVFFPVLSRVCVCVCVCISCAGPSVWYSVQRHQGRLSHGHLDVGKNMTNVALLCVWDWSGCQDVFSSACE